MGHVPKELPKDMVESRMTHGGRIAAEGSSKNPVIFELSEFKGRRLLDIRKWYKDKSGDLHRTQKGLTLTSASYEMLTRVLTDNQEVILTWFDEEGDVGFKRRELRITRKAKAQSDYELDGFETQEGNWKSPEFFDVEARGGATLLTLNASHPFVNAWKSLSSELGETAPHLKEQFECLMQSVLFAFGKAKSLSDCGRDSEVEIMLDSLVMNWGIALQRHQAATDDS